MIGHRCNFGPYEPEFLQNSVRYEIRAQPAFDVRWAFVT